MKTLALLLLVPSLAACTTGVTAVSQNCSGFSGVNYENCVEAYTPHYAPVSHWQMTTAIYKGFNSVGLASAASTGPQPLPPYNH